MQDFFAIVQNIIYYYNIIIWLNVSFITHTRFITPLKCFLFFAWSPLMFLVWLKLIH